MLKTVILIDGGYFDRLNYYLKDMKGIKIDIEKFSEKICEELSNRIKKEIFHVRTKFYHSNPYKSNNPTEEEERKYRNAQRFFNAINQKPRHEFFAVGRVKLVPAKCPYCEKPFQLPKQKGVDVGLALDLIRMARQKVADIFVLVSGDEDLTDAVKMAKEFLCQVYVFYAYDKEYGIYGSRKLNDAADDRINMTLDFLKECAK